MVDVDEIMRRAKEASDRASKSLNESMEKSKKLAEQMHTETQEDKTEEEREAEQTAANTQRQVEIMGQMFSPEDLAQIAANEEMIQRMVDERVSEATALGVDGMMEQLFGEKMAVIAAAMETLEMEDDEDDEDQEFDLELEEELYEILNEKMIQIASLQESEPVPYLKDSPQWENFGILLSGIISNLNGHELDSMDVEEHIPVLEQQIVSIVRRSWGINGRGELLDTIRYLVQEGYTLRYAIYCDAASPEDLMNEDLDEEEQESIRRGWRFAQHYKEQFTPSFLAGWDIGRAAMLARWGCYLGWITPGEASGILWDLSQLAMERLHSWREFAQSYLFGGLMWKLLCGDCDAESYLGYLADAATDLLTDQDEDSGQWRRCPWPAMPKIGFAG